MPLPSLLVCRHTHQSSSSTPRQHQHTSTFSRQTWLSLIHKEGNERCFMYTIQYDCTTFTSRVNILNENTLPDIQITLYFIMSSIFYCLYYTLCLTLVLWFSIRTCKTELYLFQLAISDCYVYPSTWNIIGNNRENTIQL